MTTHGYALNVDLDPAPFTQWITACGLEDAQFTSMAAELGSPVTVADVRPAAAEALAEVFALELRPAPVTGSIATAGSAVCPPLDWPDGDVAARRRASAPAAVDEGPRAEHRRQVLGRRASCSTARAS